MHHTPSRRCPVRLGWSDLSLRTKGFVVVSIPVWAMVFGGFFAFWANQAQDRATIWVQRSTLVRFELDRLLDQVTNAGGGTRAYLLAREEDFLTPYYTLSQGMPAILTRLNRLVEDDARQSERMRRIKASLEENLALLSALVEGAKIMAPDPNHQKELLGRAKLAAETLRREVGEMDAQESRLQVQRQAELIRIERWRSLAEAGEVVVGLLGTLAAVQLFSAGIVRRVRHLGVNADRLADGLPLVTLPQAGGDEIGALARQLEVAGALLTERGREVAESLVREQQARLEAERANRAKSEFLSRMSHELRTPLNAILGFGQLLEFSSLQEGDRQSVAHILKGGRHLLGLIDEVLDLARVDAGKLDLQFSAISLEALARECLVFVGEMARPRRVSFEVAEGGHAATMVLADERRLRQIILNLLSNAIKYNREGGRVRVACARSQDGSQMRLQVSDDGNGLTAEALSSLFVPFERLGQELGEVEGSGLGLVVSQSLAEAMGGSMGAASEVGQGSTFWVELPLATNAIPASAQAGDSDRAMAAAPSGDDSGATLLYIEDQVSNVQLVASIVERLRPRWRLLTARDGRVGLEQAHDHRPEIILLDLQLSGMSGEAVLAELRADPELGSTPVLLLSADATNGSLQRLLGLGADDYLGKPFDVDHLLGRIDALLAAARGETFPVATLGS